MSDLQWDQQHAVRVHVRKQLDDQEEEGGSGAAGAAGAGGGGGAGGAWWGRK